MRPVHLAERPQVGELRLQRASVGFHLRRHRRGVERRERRLAGTGRGLLEHHVRVLLCLAQDLVAPGPGFLGEPVAVGLRVCHVTVGCELRAGQDPHRVDMRVLPAEQDTVTA